MNDSPAVAVGLLERSVRSSTRSSYRLPISALLLLVLSLIAFWRPYLSRAQVADPYVHMHAILGVAWLLLLMAQPLLIKAAMHAQHRMLGRVGVVLGFVFASSGVLLSHRSLVIMGAEQFAREGRFVYLPLIMAAIFATALAMAVHYRKSPALHSRFMAATLLPLLDPVLARLLYFHAPPLPAEYLYQVPSFVLIVVVLALLAKSIPVAMNGRPAFAWFSVGTSIVLLGFFVVPGSDAWLAFTGWFRDLPFT
jgi:hypothetical protein